MYPFIPYYNFYNPRLFTFGRFGFPCGRRYKTIMGIPIFKTIGVTSTRETVSYQIDKIGFCSLPKEGIFFLDVKQEVPCGTGELPITFNTEDSTEDALLKNAKQESVPAKDLAVNTRYLIYYNRCENVYQLVNAYPKDTCWSPYNDSKKTNK